MLQVVLLFAGESGKGVGKLGEIGLGKRHYNKEMRMKEIRRVSN